MFRKRHSTRREAPQQGEPGVPPIEPEKKQEECACPDKNTRETETRDSSHAKYLEEYITLYDSVKNDLQEMKANFIKERDHFRDFQKEITEKLLNLNSQQELVTKLEKQDSDDESSDFRELRTEIGDLRELIQKVAFGSQHETAVVPAPRFQVVGNELDVFMKWQPDATILNMPQTGSLESWGSSGNGKRIDVLTDELKKTNQAVVSLQQQMGELGANERLATTNIRILTAAINGTPETRGILRRLTEIEGRLNVQAGTDVEESHASALESFDRIRKGGVKVTGDGGPLYSMPTGSVPEKQKEPERLGDLRLGLATRAVQPSHPL